MIPSKSSAICITVDEESENTSRRLVGIIRQQIIQDMPKLSVISWIATYKSQNMSWMNRGNMTHSKHVHTHPLVSDVPNCEFQTPHGINVGMFISV